ncbi:MAG TPA: DUF1501 domain-containing protein [Pirellulales bacterium]|jgi:hypothetical protein|nr:DUF1501 domain-containing protein [Pirellulales bacterium]
MLTIYGNRQSAFCDRVSRRNFLRIGGLAMGGLSLPQILRAEQASGIRASNKAIIMVYLPGGPPHQDTYDLKVDAPAEIRGEFNPIQTNVPGIEICELLPKLAANMDKLAVLRTLVGARDDHASFQCLTGRLMGGRQPEGGWPEFGSVAARLLSSTPGAPPFVGLSPRMQHKPYNSGKPGFLGPAYAPFQPNGDGRDDLVLQGTSVDRLNDRKALLAGFDRFRYEADTSGAMRGLDGIHQQAFGLLTSSKLAAALDLTKEDPHVVARYGQGTTQHQGDGAPRINEQFLLARRLVEAGVKCVTLSYSFWDWHGQNFRNARQNLPPFDQAVSALVEDLHQRGLDKDVSVVVWGEFGRTPKINKDAGRDHWPNVSCALLAGGGMKTGQVIGATDRLGEGPKDRPVTFQEVFATLYQRLGIDASATTLPDLSGRPQYLVDDNAQPIHELI